MTAEPARISPSFYPCKDESELGRDEKRVSFQVGSKRCRDAWCKKEGEKGWIDREKPYLGGMDYSRTRHVILTVDPKKFESPEQALEYFKKGGLLRGFIRNLKRGKHEKIGKQWVWLYKPVNITNWRAYLEWYRNGYFHLHVFIEVAQRGAGGMIGGDMLRYFWKMGDWVIERPVKSKQHWWHIMGDFQKRGYFGGKKDHQGKLPAWAMDIPGLKIRRSTGQRRCAPAGNMGAVVELKRGFKEDVDLETGEILGNCKIARVMSNLTYRQKFKECCQKVWVKMSTDLECIEGIFNIPWRDILKKYEGEFLKGLGYVFKGSVKDMSEFLSMSERIISIKKFTPLVWKNERVGLYQYKWCLREELENG